MTPDQSDFSRALLDPSLETPKNLVAPNGSTPDTRFKIYRNNVNVSLLEAMRVGFPTIEKLLGANNFKTLALSYIRDNPPQSPVLMFYGQGFDRFIEDFEHLADLPYMADVARLELLRRKIYHAKDGPIFGPDQLQEMGEAAVMAGFLKPAPSTAILPSDYPVFDIWHRNNIDDEHVISQVGQSVLITRPNLDLEMRALSPQVATFLGLLENHTVGAAIELTLGETPDFPLGDALTVILQSGFAASLETEEQ